MNFNDYVEDYCEGQLDKSKINDFEKAMIADSSLAAAVIKYREGKKLSEGLLEIDIMETIDGLSRENNSVGKDLKRIKRRFLFGKIAAVAAIVGIGFFPFWIMTKSIDPDDMYTSLYEEPIWPIERGNSEALLSQAVSQYLGGDLEGAKTILLDSLDDKILGRFWLAEIYMKEGFLDSVGTYLPKSNQFKEESNRIIYINSLLAIRKGNLEDASILVRQLPKLEYKKIHKLLGQ